jgi:(4-O-methyl)-D-glucuronate---lignin esterase
MISRGSKVAAYLAFVCLSSYSLPAQTLTPAPPAAPSADELLREFQNPPNGARPRVWWHWMNGNIAQEGIKLDLDWMHSVGIGGVTIFEGAISTPQVVPKRLIYMTPEWKQAFKDAVTTARSFNMEVAIASSPGWSETGGPWVPAAQGMKKMVWSATRVDGGEPFTGKLPHPPQVDGTFQDFKVSGRRGPDGKVVVPPEFYGDVTVIAYKLPYDDKTQAELNPKISASGGTPDVVALSDGDVNAVALELSPAEKGSEAWMQFDYGHPQEIQAVTLAALDGMISVFDHETSNVPPWIESSDDGAEYRKIADIPFSSLPQRTVSFNAVTARYFRIVYPKGTATQRITEAVLSSGARINEFEKRAGYANTRNFYAITDPKVAPESIVAPKDVVDLTGKMRPDGTLDWTPPSGKWMILRIGYSLTGHENGPAPAEATGLEVDKFNREYVKNYVDGYLKMYADTVGDRMMGKDGISYMLTDSIEVGPQNWTDKMLDEFEKRRGYDARPWLPALTGVVIKSIEDTDRFLWDFRRTISQLLAENHYGEISEELHAHGLRYYGEALEQHRPSLGDDIEMRSKTDIPMGAMWTWAGEPGPESSYIADLRGAASVAHIYGQNIVGAESMTSRGPAWSFSPNNLKTVADLEFALGVNRFQIHESSHQPLADMAPGLTLGPYGLWFNRNDTWADLAGPWVTYLARCSYLLQQGHFYADVAYFYGEEGPLTAVFGWKAQQDAPEGFGFDFVNSDVILNHLKFSDGRLATPGGTSYRILYLGGRSQRMTLPVLEQLTNLVREGAVIVGNKPVDSPSLTDDEVRFHRLADQLFGRGSSAAGTVRKLGKGHVYIGMSANDVLKALDTPRDFEYSEPEADTDLMFLHRKLDDGEIYFVDNRNARAERLDATFRVAGKTPELWDPATGTTAPVGYKIAEGRTTIPLHLDLNGSTFVVFTKPATEMSVDVPESNEMPVASLSEALNSDWKVSFQPGRGAPQSAEFDRLTSWSENANDGIRYFSGTATYTKTLNIPDDTMSSGAHYWLDLGEVKDVAEVAVNGRNLGILWKAPFEVDISSALRPGSNELVIKVTNLWVNRLIGDQQSYAVKKYTFTDFAPYKASSPLLRSGLLGPVRIMTAAE